MRRALDRHALRYLVRFATLALAALTAPVTGTSAQAAMPLPALHAEASRTSVSGLSSGGFMAVQYAVAFSSQVVGVGVIAGGPYNCANVGPGPAPARVLGCMVGTPSGAGSWNSARQLAAQGGIDPVAGLARQKVYVFGGTKDNLVPLPVDAATRDFFLAAGVAPSNLAYVDIVPSGHAFVSPAIGNACGSSAVPYIDRCDLDGSPYDQPLDILQHIYGPLNPPASRPSAQPVGFDQRGFAGASSSLDSTGYVYIPRACAPDGDGCAVHVVLHGCLQGAANVGDQVYSALGYNRWADTNRIIVLYPQVAGLGLANPNGCWDWWGYTGSNFMLRSGVQLAAIKAMVDRLTLPR